MVRPRSVSVIVPARNAEDAIGGCLSSLLRLDYPPERIEIIAVDNASTDRTGEIIKSYPVRYLYERRRGPSSARNCGIRESRGEILAFIDADCVATPGWLTELVKRFEDAEVWGVAGEVTPHNPRTPAERYMAVRRPRIQELVLARNRPYAGTGNVAFRRRTFDTIGLFDARLPFGEDKDFGWRVSAAGLALAYSPQAVVFHRPRKTAWRLFRQFAGWGYGHALVHRKHRLRSSVRRELPEAEIVFALRDLAATAARYSLRRGDAMKVWFDYLELLRRIGLRLGASYGLLRPM